MLFRNAKSGRPKSAGDRGNESAVLQRRRKGRNSGAQSQASIENQKPAPGPQQDFFARRSGARRVKCSLGTVGRISGAGQ